MIGQVTLPGTPIRVSRLSFGTASLHHLFSKRDRYALLGAAAEQGITHFDTSPYYGFGLAEQALGAFLRGHGASLTVATKFGLYPPRLHLPGTLGVWSAKALGRVLPELSRPIVDWSLGVADKSLSRSLRRLDRDCVDILFLHEPRPEWVNADEVLRWLDRQKQAGKIRCYGLAGLVEPMLPWVEHGNPLADLVQVKDSLDDREADPLLERGRKLQLTFGYLTGAQGAGQNDAGHILKEALARNGTGSVLFSTRRIDRIRALVSRIEGSSR